MMRRLTYGIGSNPWYLSIFMWRKIMSHFIVDILTRMTTLTFSLVTNNTEHPVSTRI